MPKAMRVALVVRPARGGIRRHVSQLVSGILPEEVAYTGYAPADFVPDSNPFCIPFIPTDISAKTSLIRDLRTIRTLAAQFGGASDLVHAHGLRAAILGVAAARRAGVPAIYTAHNLVSGLNSLQKIALRATSRRCARIIAVSEAVSRSLRAILGDAARILVIPNGIRMADYAGAEPANRRPLGLNENAFVILFAGRLSPEKGLDTLLSAYRLLGSEPGKVSLLVAGDGPDADGLRCAPQEGVYYLGERRDIPSLLSAADLVVVPSNSEGQGIIALEALAAGKPVIASDVGGLSEIVQPGATGTLVPPRQPAALAEAIRQVLADPVPALEMAARGRSMVAQQYSTESMFSAIKSAYRGEGRS